MSMTPLQEVEARLHEHYGDAPPTKEEAGKFLLKQFPRMDGGIAIAIALAALALQGWQVYRSERDRYKQNKASGGGSNCPQCGSPALSRNAAGQSVCVNSHAW